MSLGAKPDGERPGWRTRPPGGGVGGAGGGGWGHLGTLAFKYSMCRLVLPSCVRAYFSQFFIFPGSFLF